LQEWRRRAHSIALTFTTHSRSLGCKVATFGHSAACDWRVFRFCAQQGMTSRAECPSAYHYRSFIFKEASREHDRWSILLAPIWVHLLSGRQRLLANRDLLKPVFWDVMVANCLKAVSWIFIGALVITTIVPANERPVTGLQHDFEHFCAFAAAGLIFGLGYAWQLRTLLLGAIVFTLLLELSQIPLPTRHARLEDFIVDAAAVCLAILVAQFIRKLKRDWVTAAP
jgi:hypothetical protein